MNSALRWFHQMIAVIPNRRYRCTQCRMETDLEGASRHAAEMQPDMRE